jgi:hypothetical protein
VYEKDADLYGFCWHTARKAQKKLPVFWTQKKPGVFFKKLPVFLKKLPAAKKLPVFFYKETFHFFSGKK